MPKKWTAELVGLLHLYNITQGRLAERLGLSYQYVSMILGGRRSPPGAEQRFRAALDELIAEQDDITISLA